MNRLSHFGFANTQRASVSNMVIVMHNISTSLRNKRILGHSLLRAAALGSALSAAAACGGSEPAEREGGSTPAAGASTQGSGVALTLRDTTITDTFSASGTAEPLQQASLSTKLMGTVLEVAVREGDAVQRGQTLVRIDDRELNAKASQLAANLAEMEATQRDVMTQLQRMRALYADSAATKAQLDAAELGNVRANAAIRTINASVSELEVTRSYAAVRAPFDGIVSKRTADPGTFAAPGMPLVTVDDVSSLRITATVAADAASSLKRGQFIEATIDGRATKAKVEGIVSAGAGNLFTINAVVPNARNEFRAGSSAVLHLPGAARVALLVPSTAIIRDGDLTGVVVRAGSRDERRWIRLGAAFGTQVEVTAGLVAGETIVDPRNAPQAPVPNKPEF